MVWEKELPEQSFDADDSHYYTIYGRGVLTEGGSTASTINLQVSISNRAVHYRGYGWNFPEASATLTSNFGEVISTPAFPSKSIGSSYTERGTATFEVPSSWRGEPVSLSFYGCTWSFVLDVPLHGSIHLYEDGAFAPYQPYIYDGSKWEPYAPYIHNGSEWEQYS